MVLNNDALMRAFGMGPYWRRFGLTSPTTLGTEIGKDTSVTINDDDRRKGLYLLGKAGMGKTTLMTNTILRDISEGHGIFFLDPHGDAIKDIIKRTTTPILVIDPEDETHSFGINLLSCQDITSRKERGDTYARAYGVFHKLWADEKGELSPWLQLIVENMLYVFIENQSYTLADVPIFLLNPNFRNQLLENVKYNREPVDFWRYEFQLDQAQAALVRVRSLLSSPYVKYIIGQQCTTLNFSDIIENKKVLFAKLSANLPEDVKRFIGTIVINELLFAVRKRIEVPEEKRHLFCIFVDEFQNFASAEDFGILFTEARKYGTAATIAHQERFGQFAGNKKIQGATLASVNKVAFQLTGYDAAELASEFAQPPPTETKLEPERPLSPNPFWDLVKYGHGNATIQAFVVKKFMVLSQRIDHYKPEIEHWQARRTQLQQEAARYRDASGLYNIEGRQAHFERGMPSAERHALSSEYAVKQQLIAVHEQIRVAAQKVDMYAELSTINQRFANIINSHLYAVLDGSITVDTRSEHLAELILAIRELSWDFYIGIRFGDPKVPRQCPATFAYQCFPRELEDVFVDKERKYTRDEKHLQNARVHFRKSENFAYDSDDKIYLRIRRMEDYGPDSTLGTHETLSDLPPRTYTEAERAKILAAYLEMKSWWVERTDEVVEFLRLIARPENRVRVTSHHLTEKQVNTRTHKDMADEIVHDLVALPPFTAYVKTDGKYKVKTSPLPNPTGERSMQEVITDTRSQCCKARDAIDNEIQTRREQALKNSTPKPKVKNRRKSEPNNEGGPEEPPPTSFSR